MALLALIVSHPGDWSKRGTPDNKSIVVAPDPAGICSGTWAEARLPARGRRYKTTVCGIFAGHSGDNLALVEQIDKDLVAAMKARHSLKLSVMRMVKSAFKLKQVELGKPLADAEALAVMRTLVKQRRESAEQFRQGGRDELADKEEAEIKIIEGYLPTAASDEEIDAAVAAAIAETGAASAKDIGKAMKAAMARLAGKNADGKRVNEKVRAKLGA